jgi:hypothetical protein
MATRAAIIYFDPEKLEAVSTYNHYDGYPENLGAGLENHYNDDMYAKKIASEGYISYLDPETGDVEVSNPRDKDVDPDRMRLSDDMDQTAMDLAEMINSYGADYAYIWSPAVDKWMTIKGGSTKSIYTTIDQLMPELFGMGTNPENDPQAGDFMTEWKTFLNEANDLDKVMSQAFFKLQDEPKEMLSAYKASLTNDIRLNGPDAYADFSVEDFIEDYENYIGDKMDL